MHELKSLNEVLKYFYEFYEKELTDFTIALWASVLSEFDIYQIKRGFLDYSKKKEGKYCPKPSQIYEICREYKGKTAIRIEESKPKFKSLHDAEYQQALQMTFSTDREESKKGFEWLNDVRKKIGSEFLLYKNGLNYQLKPTKSGGF